MQTLTRFFLWPFDDQNQALAAGLGYWFTIIGFAATWYGLWLAHAQIKATKTAVDANNEAIEAVKFRVTQFEATSEIAKAKAALDGARASIEAADWRRASTSYEDLRRSLISLRTERVKLGDELVTNMGSTVRQISGFCKKVDIALHQNGQLPDIVQSLEHARKHHDVLHEVAEALQLRTF